METDLADIGVELVAAGGDEAADEIDRVTAAVGRLAREYSRLIGGGGATRGGFFQNLLGSAGTSKEISRAFDGFLVKGKTASDVVKGLEQDLLRLGSQHFAGGGSISGLGSAALGSLFPGFASGGSFTVGGAAGRDKNLVGLRLSRGEEVTVRTPAQQKNVNISDASPMNLSFNYNIQAADVDSFRRSQSQLQAEALRHAQRLLKRNG